ncbi:DUF305 domain-containing protein [Actinacidiphila sp. bgisy160]|uniref:DUF305 domain-containing protein n=1 Tax=Actinacidiphila sp. bgisy160 TaxID=3413796 RepID=UPI003D75AF80
MFSSHRVTTPPLLALAASLVLTLTSCDGGSGSNSAPPAPSVIAPGAPGEKATTLSRDEAAKALPDDSPNAADLAYVTNMIAHHQQALVMTALADSHAWDQRVRGLAARIDAAQGPEIDTMEAWLKTNGGSHGTAHGHDHASMPGMATAAQLAALREARGKEFDRQFLRLMIAHHRGAVTMATDELTHGRNVQVGEWANEVIAQQSAEIARMRAMG